MESFSMGAVYEVLHSEQENVSIYNTITSPASSYSELSKQCVWAKTRYHCLKKSLGLEYIIE